VPPGLFGPVGAYPIGKIVAASFTVINEHADLGAVAATGLEPQSVSSAIETKRTRTP
jgi:hypothetical protein